MNPIRNLGAAAAPADDPKLKQVAKQFEAIFLNELFKGLQKPPNDGEESLLGVSQASQTFNQLHHQALSDQAAGGIGIADLLYRKLVAGGGSAASEGAKVRSQP